MVGLRRFSCAVVIAVLVFVFVVSCAAAKETPPPAKAPRSHSTSEVVALVPPSAACTDFYTFACSDWLAAHPIPPETSSWSPYDEITQQNREVVHAILDESREHGGVVGTYYAACMDEKAIEARGTKPLDPDLAAISAISSRADLLRVVASLARRGVRTVIDVLSEQDYADAKRVIASADRAVFPLQVKQNYLSDDEHAAGLRAAYEKHLARMFGLLAEPADAAAIDAKRVIDLERALAETSRDETARRDPKGRHNPVVVARAPNGSFDWSGYLKLAGAKGVTTINVHDPDYFAGLNKVLGSPALDLPAWRAFLRARLVHATQALLPAAFVEADFDFFQRTLRGTKEMAPRWKRCANLVDRDVGEALGQLFVARAFPEANKAKALRLVEAVRDALRADLTSATWLGEPTRQAALTKLAAVRVKIGYPDHFLDYSSIRLTKDDAFGNAERAATFEFDRQLGKIGRPVDRDEWFELPQTLDAYGSNQLNEVAFTAGFLQPPLFDPGADVATTFGSLGAVIGHELTHRFDDSGRNFDADGNLRDWWTAEDAKQYSSRAACFEKQYSGYLVGTDHVDGKLTLGENIADNGGLRLAFHAAHLDPGSPDAQRFFLAWARIRCGNITTEAARTRLRGDPHSPGRYRAIGAVANMPEFQQAFGCAIDSPMMNEPVCRLW